MKGPVRAESASALIDEMIKELGDWRGKTLARVRELYTRQILTSSRNGSGWEARCGLDDGIIAVGNGHKDKVKLTFAHGASLPDPDKVFNAGLGGNAWRAIDLVRGRQD